MSTASDLIYAALKYYKFTGDINAVNAAKVILAKYTLCRNPTTGLHGQLYTVPIKQQEPVTPRDVESWFGDRAQRQFGERFGAVALEMNLLSLHEAKIVYGFNPLMLFSCFIEQGEVIRPLCEEAVESLEAFVATVYDSTTKMCKPMFTDGTDLSGYVFEKIGYYSATGKSFQQYKLQPEMASAICLGSVLFNSQSLTTVAKDIFVQYELGTVNTSLNQAPTINLTTTCDDPDIILLLLKLYKITSIQEYLTLAGILVKNIVDNGWVDPYFKKYTDSRFACFSAAEPFAIANYLAVLQNKDISNSLCTYGTIYGKFFVGVRRGSVTLFDKQFFKNARISQQQLV